MRPPFLLLVTGSRTWDRTRVIERALAVILAVAFREALVRGACTCGADALAAAHAAGPAGYRIEAHSAAWHGTAAAPGTRGTPR
jgi:YspA, cpYpsA-related SLOG family